MAGINNLGNNLKLQRTQQLKATAQVNTQNNKGKITGMDIFKFVLVVYFVGLLAFVIFLLTNNILLPALIVIVCLVLRIKKLVDNNEYPNDLWG